MKLNPYKEAAKEAPNLLGLAGLAAASMAMLNPLPLIAGVVAETMYLLTIPDTNWYRRRMSLKEDKLFAEETLARREALKAQMLPLLDPTMVARYNKLEDARLQIEKDPTLKDEWYYHDILGKMDHLLERFLAFAGKDIQFRRYIQKLLSEAGAVAGPTPPKITKQKRRLGDDEVRLIEQEEAPAPIGDNFDVWVQNAVKKITESYQGEQKQIQDLITLSAPDDRTSAVVQKRLEVIQRRADYIARIGKILINLNHQMKLLEDTFGLISDEIRARPPKEVLTDIEDVVFQTNIMSEALDEMSIFDEEQTVNA
jgi:hypothetical protein